MSVARTYAKALYETVKSQNGAAVPVERLVEQLKDLNQAIEANKELRVALFSPATSTSEKTAVIEAVSERGQFSEVLRNFLILLARKGRFSILAEVGEALDEVRIEAQGGVLGRVQSADALGDADLKSLSEAFTKKIGKPVELRADTEPDLLAGVKVTVSGVTYDGTLRSQLSRLREQVVQGTAVTQ